MAPTVLYVVLAGPPLMFYLVVALVAALCYWEFCNIAKIELPEKVAGVAAGSLFLYLQGEQAVLSVILVPLLALAAAMRRRDLPDVLPSAAVQIFGLLYIYGSWKTAFFLRAVSPYWLTFGLAVNWLGDSGAYYVGRNFGRHKLAPIVSPGKTWEGAAASAATSVIFGILFLPRFVAIGLLSAALVAFIANAAGQLGDLAESAIKRGAGVKDSGTLLPGHGGMLDRVDSSLYSLPFLFLVIYLTGRI